MTIAAADSIPVTPDRGVSRDEMNLAEFPLAVLSTRADPRVKTLEFEDTIVSKNGERIQRQWVITGADKFGLPTASDDEVLLGLMKLTVDYGFRAKKVKFTRYELLHILHWSTEGRSYSRLQNALDRLSGVRIKATNAFFDNESKSHSTKNFGIIDAYEINDGRDLNPKPSFFIWSEELFKSFQAGFIKKLDLDFLLQLESAVSKRLYRYLDKHFWYRSKVQINLFTIAHEKIGISRNYRFASSLKQQLQPALQELIEVGFLGRFEYLGSGRDTEIVLYAASGKPRSLAAEGIKIEIDRRVAPAEGTAQDISSSGADEPAAPQLDILIGKLVLRGLRDHQARKLLAQRSGEELGRIDRIVDHFDQLVQSKSHLVSRSPVGFLYRAVQEPHKFVLPDERVRAQSVSDSHKGGAGSGQGRGVRRDCSPAQNQQVFSFVTAMQSEYQQLREGELVRIRSSIEATLEAKLIEEVESALRRLKGQISDVRFHQAVIHGVDERLLKLFAFPSFEQWLESAKKQSH